MEMIKLETHLHCQGGSGCGKATAKEIVAEYSKQGYNALVLTNHNCEICTKNYLGITYKEKLNFYFSLIDNLTVEAEKHNIKVFWGAETRVITSDDSYQEYMLYGMERKFLFDNEPLFYNTQEELFKLCDKNGIFMYQTHPFREGVKCGNPKFIHGVEAFNGHVGHKNNNDMAVELAKKYNLKMMSGSDYHEYHQPITGGIYIPKNIENEHQLADYLFNNQVELIEKKDKLCK